MPTANLYTDSSRAPSLELGEAGDRARRTYWVDTHNEEAAAEAQGLPRVGDAWSATRLDLVAERVTVRYVAGTDDPVSGRGGLCEAVVEYRSVTWGGVAPRPRANLRYTEVDVGVATEEIRWDTRTVDPTFVGPPAPGSPAYPIANGQGCMREVNVYSVRVVTFWRPAELNDASLAGLIDIGQTQNENRVVLPPLHGLNGAARIAVEVGEGRYRAFRTQPAAGPRGEPLVQLTHEIALAPTHDWIWRVQLADGAAGPVVQSQRYRSATWPAGMF
jgi:hypothetical protein